MKHFISMCLLLYIHTSQSEIHHRSLIEGSDVSLYCKHKVKVVWSKGTDGYRSDILTAESKENIQKHKADPHNRYSVTDELDLDIKNLSLSDSGIYFCNANPTVNLTVTASDKTRSTTSSNDQTESTTTPADKTRSTTSSNDQTESTTTPAVSEIFTSMLSVAQTSNTHHTDQPKPTQATHTSTGNSDVNNPSSQTNTTVTSTTDLSTTSTTSSTTTEKNNITTSKSNTQPGATTLPPTDPSKIAAAVSGGVVFVVLVLLLWACIKRKDILAALSNKKENIYETVDDSDFTAQPVPSQKPNDAIYYLAGDPDIVKLGRIQETDDNTYTLISQSKEKIPEQEQNVPLYSTINVDTINQL